MKGGLFVPHWNDWEMCGYATNTSAVTSFTCTLRRTFRFLRVYLHCMGLSVGDRVSWRFNGDTGTNYGWQISRSSAAATGNTAQTSMSYTASAGTNTTPRLIVFNVLNISSSQKLVTGCSITISSGTVTEQSHFAGTWNNTSAQITSIEARTLSGTPTYTAGSSVAVFGSNF